MITKDEADFKLMQIKACISILSHQKEYKEACSKLCKDVDELREYISKTNSYPMKATDEDVKDS